MMPAEVEVMPTACLRVEEKWQAQHSAALSVVEARQQVASQPEAAAWVQLSVQQQAASRLAEAVEVRLSVQQPEVLRLAEAAEL